MVELAARNGRIGVILMLWVIPDTHFEHNAMVRSCGRPVNFTALICENWRKMVIPKDTVIHLGDCAWTPDGMKRLLSLPGRKILIRGNHDDKSLVKYMSIGWDFACDSIVMKLGGVTILFSHAPRWGHTADINIHGHFHDLHREDFSRLYLPLSLESMGYMPIALDEAFLGVISSWVDTRRIPKLKEIYEHRQNHRPLSVRDVYGQQGREHFISEFIKHSTNGDVSSFDGYLDVDSVLSSYGISENLIV